MVFVLSFMLGDTSIPPTILVLSGHDIFESLFRPILRSFLECFFFHFSNVPFMTLCYVRIPKESGRCRERKVGGSEARPADSY